MLWSTPRSAYAPIEAPADRASLITQYQEAKTMDVLTASLTVPVKPLPVFEPCIEILLLRGVGAVVTVCVRLSIISLRRQAQFTHSLTC
jgi:hypothetical protein